MYNTKKKKIVKRNKITRVNHPTVTTQLQIIYAQKKLRCIFIFKHNYTKKKKNKIKLRCIAAMTELANVRIDKKKLCITEKKKNV